MDFSPCLCLTRPQKTVMGSELPCRPNIRAAAFYTVNPWREISIPASRMISQLPPSSLSVWALGDGVMECWSAGVMECWRRNVNRYIVNRESWDRSPPRCLLAKAFGVASCVGGSFARRVAKLYAVIRASSFFHPPLTYHFFLAPV